VTAESLQGLFILTKVVCNFRRSFQTTAKTVPQHKLQKNHEHPTSLGRRRVVNTASLNKLLYPSQPNYAG